MSTVLIMIILKMSFGTTKMAIFRIKLCMLVRNKNMEMFTGLILYIRTFMKLIISNIIYSIQYQVSPKRSGYSLI